MQTSQFPTTTANAARPRTTPPVMFGYSGSTLHPSRFKLENQANPMPGFGLPLNIRGGTTPQPYRTATLTFSRRPPGNRGYAVIVQPRVPHPIRPIPPPLNQNVLANMIERMCRPLF